MLFITGVDSVLRSSNTNATKKMIDSGVAGRSIMAVVNECGGVGRN